MDFLEGLNPQQREAVRHAEGPLLILAGAGSGKTRVITHRIAWLVCERRVPPWAILAVTFTNKAAREMRDRVQALLQGRIAADNAPLVCTFHSFCVRLLRRYGTRLNELRPGFTTGFVIWDDDDQLAVVKSIYKQLGADDKSLPPRQALAMISAAKCGKKSPSQLQAEARDPFSERLAKIYEQYEGRLRAANALDFDDLLLEAVRLLEYDAGVRLGWRERLQYLMIDEYQDTNRNQYELARLLAGERRNICVVGDEDQSIYSWRGADIRNILDFERDFPNARVIRLEQNYRSTKRILEAAACVVAHNKLRIGKTLWTAGPEGEKITLYEALDGENEALFIADTIDKLLTTEPACRVAVLYRTNFQSRQIEEALRRYGRKYAVVGGFSFYQRAEIKDALAYLRLLVCPSDNISLLRVINTPARGIGRAAIEAIEQVAAAQGLSYWDAIARLLELGDLGPRTLNALSAFRSLILELRNQSTQRVDELLEAILEQTGYRKMLEQDSGEDAETRLANINELLNAAAEAAERGESITEFLDHAALVSEADGVDEKAQVSLLTVHNAKGLEFPVVFIAGLEEGLFPHSRSLGSEAMLEEERRLCYVGMTRAERRLYLSWARFRRRFGGGPPEPSIASRFLREIPARLMQTSAAAAALPEVDLWAEQNEVWRAARANLYTGKASNSVENIARFFGQRDQAGASRPPAPVAKAPAVASSKPPAQTVSRQPAGKSELKAGSRIVHSKYGQGTVVRKEGEGPDARLTVSFPGYGLKKLIAKFAGLTDEA